MADNFVELKIKLDEQDLADQLLSAFASSPQLAAQLSGAIAPFVDTILKSEGGVEDLNEGLSRAIDLSRIITEQMNVLQGKANAAAESEAKGLDRIAKLRKEANELIAIQLAGIEQSSDAHSELLGLQFQLNDIAEQEVEGQEELARVATIIRKVKKTTADAERKDIESLIKLSRTQTDQAQDALDDLIERRILLNEAVEDGIENEEERQRTIANLRKLEDATSERRRKQIRDRVDEREKEKEEVRELGILSKINSERGRAALSELTGRRKLLLASIEAEGTGREEALRLAERLAEVETAITRNVGAGRAALRRQRSVGGPDTFGTLLNLERIVQDLPFGLIGIANNLGPFFDQFTFFIQQIDDTPSKLARLRKGIGLLSRALIFTPIGWITLLNVVTSLLIGGDKLLDFLIKVGDFLGIADSNARDLAKNLKELTEENFDFDIGAQELEQEVAVLEQTFIRMSAQLENLRKQAKSRGLIGALDNIGARILDVLRFDPKGFVLGDSLVGTVLETRDEVDKLEDQLNRLKKISQETTALVAADFQTILFGGTTSKLSEELKKQEDERKKSLTAQLEDIERFNDSAIDAAITRIEEEEKLRQKELLKEAARLDRLREELLVTLKTTDEELTAEQIALIEGRIRTVEMLSDGIFLELSRLSEQTANKIREEEERLDREAERRRRERERRLNEIRKAADQIADLRVDIDKTIESVQEASLERRIKIAEQETKKQRRELESQLRDFKGTEEQKEEFTALTSRRIKLIDEELNKERERLARDHAREVQLANLDLIEMRMKVAETTIDTSSTINSKLESEQRRHSSKLLEIERELIELSLKDQTDLVKQRINLLLDLLNAEKELNEQRIDFIVETEERRVSSAIKELQFGIESAKFDAEAALRLDSETRFERERRLLDLEIARREFEEESRFESEQARIKEEFDENQQNKLLEQLEIEHEERMLQIQREGANSRKDLRNKELGEIISSSLQFFSQQANTLSQIADINATISENSRRAELVGQGKTEKEINEIIEAESGKRLAMKKRMAKISIVASTAVAAVEAYRSVMETPFLPFFVKLPLALGAAGLAIAFGAAQIRAVDSERLSGASEGGAASNIAIGEITPPGIQDDNPLITGFQSPFSVVSGLSGTSGRIGVSSNGELAGLRGDIKELTRVNEGRPILADIPESNAQRIVRLGLEQEDKLSRP